MNRLLVMSLLGMSLMGNATCAASHSTAKGQTKQHSTTEPGKEPVQALETKTPGLAGWPTPPAGTRVTDLLESSNQQERVLPETEVQEGSQNILELTKTAVDATFSRFGREKIDTKAIHEFSNEVHSAYKQRPIDQTSEKAGAFTVQTTSRTATDIRNGLRSKLGLIRTNLNNHVVREQTKLITKAAPEVGRLYNERGESFWKKRGIKSVEDLHNRSNELIAEIANGREHMSLGERMGSWLKKQIMSLPVKSPLALAGMITLAVITIKAIGIFTGGIGFAVPCLAVGIWFGVRHFNRNRVKKALMEVIDFQREGLDIGTNDFQNLFQSVVDAQKQLKDAAELPTKTELQHVVKLFQKYSPTLEAE